METIIPQCASVLGHLKIINFPFVPNGKFIIFRCPKIWAHYSLIIMCLNIGTPNNHHFPYGTDGKVVVLGVPIHVLEHFRVIFPEKFDLELLHLDLFQSSR